MGGLGEQRSAKVSLLGTFMSQVNRYDQQLCSPSPLYVETLVWGTNSCPPIEDYHQEKNRQRGADGKTLTINFNRTSSDLQGQKN